MRRYTYQKRKGFETNMMEALMPGQPLNISSFHTITKTIKRKIVEHLNELLRPLPLHC